MWKSLAKRKSDHAKIYKNHEEMCENHRAKQKMRTYVHAQVWHECASLFGLSRFSALHTLDVSSAAKIAFEFCSLHYTFSLQSRGGVA